MAAVDDVSDVPEEWRVILHNWRTVPIHCANNHVFLEIDNVGLWQCKQHICEPKVLKNGDVLWPCCGGRGRDHPGCVDADHRRKDIVKRYNSNHDIKLPPIVASRLLQHYKRVKGKHVLTPGFGGEDPVTGEVIVARFDSFKQEVYHVPGL